MSSVKTELSQAIDQGLRIIVLNPNGDFTLYEPHRYPEVNDGYYRQHITHVELGQNNFWAIGDGLPADHHPDRQIGFDYVDNIQRAVCDFVDEVLAPQEFCWADFIPND